MIGTFSFSANHHEHSFHMTPEPAGICKTKMCCSSSGSKKREGERNKNCLMFWLPHQVFICLLCQLVTINPVHLESNRFWIHLVKYRRRRVGLGRKSVYRICIYVSRYCDQKDTLSVFHMQSSEKFVCLLLCSLSFWSS